MPDPPMGLHFDILLKVKTNPFKAPCFSSASKAYAEQVGVNLQFDPTHGESAAR